MIPYRAMRPFLSALRPTFWLLCLFCFASMNAQVGQRTTQNPPILIRLTNMSGGIKMVRMDGASPATPLYPEPGAPLELSGPLPQIRILTAKMSGATLQTFCAGDAPCAVAVRYKIGAAEKSIYVVRAGGKVILTTPDAFKTSGDYAILRKGSIVKIEEIGGTSVNFDQNTQFIVEFAQPGN